MVHHAGTKSTIKVSFQGVVGDVREPDLSNGNPSAKDLARRWKGAAFLFRYYPLRLRFRFALIAKLRFFKIIMMLELW